MVAVARELPNTGYALEVDGRLKTEFETKEGAWTGSTKKNDILTGDCGQGIVAGQSHPRGVVAPRHDVVFSYSVKSQSTVLTRGTRLLSIGKLPFSDTSRAPN